MTDHDGKNTGKMILAKLMPGEPDDAINIQTIEVSLSLAPDYSCISYIASEDTEDISRDGQAISIDSGLSKALKALRSRDTETVWWAEGLTDTIQKDDSANDLKTAFLNAKEVRLWIGQGDSHTGKAVQLLTELAEQWRAHATALGLPENWSQARPQQLMQVIQNIQQLTATESVAFPGIKGAAVVESASAFANTPYFRHVKAIASIVLAKKAIVTSREASMSWLDYSDCIDLIGASGGTLPIKCDIVHLKLVGGIRIAVRRWREHDQHLELLPMLQQSRQTECADPRDRVFAMLPITSPSKRIQLGHGIPQPPLTIDHTTSQQQIFTSAAKHIIGERQDLLLWTDSPAPSTPSRLPNLPSWVPDYSDSSETPTLKIRPSMSLRSWEYAPCVQALQKPLQITSSNTLKTQAHIFSRISKIAGHKFTDTNFHDVALENLQLLPPAEKMRGKDDYARTLVLDQWGMATKAPNSILKQWTSFAARLFVLKRLNITPQEFTADPSVLTSALPPVPDEVLRHTFRLAAKTDTTAFSQQLTQSLGRKFFVLENGCLGMGFHEADGGDEDNGIRKGDVVAVFVGACLPYVLRECDSGDGVRKFRLLGEVHVQGLMEAEALKDKGWFVSTWKDVEVCDVEIV